MFGQTRLFPRLPQPFFQGFGGDEEDRTPDPLRARQVLSQLSYTPISEDFRLFRFRFPLLLKVL